MIKDLLKLADSLDKAGFHKEADQLTKLVNPNQYANNNAQKSSSPRDTATAAVGVAAASVTGFVFLAALAGLAVGTVINKGLEKAGVNSSVISWLLQPSLKNGINYKIAIDKTAIDPLLLKGAVSFVPYGVSGILMKGNQIVNKNSNATFPVTSPVGIAQGTEVTLPQNQNGILIPTSVSVSIIYSNGSRRNAVSTPESTIFTAGSNVVVASIKTVAKTAR